MSPQGHERLPVINGLRGLACISVFYVHSLSGYTPPGFAGFNLGPLSISVGHILSATWVGVNLFFVLSGFVLYLPYARSDANSLTRDQIAVFYKRRWLRLMPLYFFITIVCILVFRPPLTSDQNLALLGHTLLGTFFFVPSAGDVPSNSPLWSIAIEIWLSIALPILIIALRAMGPVRWLVMIMTTTTALRWWGLQTAYDDTPFVFRVAVYLDTLGEFSFGIFAAHCYARRTAVYLFVKRHAASAMAIGLVGLVVFFHLHAYGRDFAWPRQVMAFHGILLNSALFLILMASISSDDRSRIARTLSVAPLQLLGMMCYSIYVWHQPVLAYFGEAHARSGWFAALPYVLGEFALIFILAAITYRFIEFPRRRLGWLLPARYASA